MSARYVKHPESCMGGELMYACIWLDGWMDGCMHGCMRMYICMNVWIDE